MWAVLWRNPMALLAAILLHLGLAFLLLFGVDWQTKPKPAHNDAPVVRAKVIDQQVLQQQEEQRKQQAEAERQQKAAAEQARQQAKQAALRKAREEEAKRQAEIKRKIEQQRQAEEQAAKLAAEAKRKAAEEAKRKAEEKARKQAEAQRKAEEAKRQAVEAKRKAEQAKRAKAEAERKRRAAEQAARERELQAQYLAEQTAAEASRIARLIQQKVARYWNRPPGSAELSLKCRIKVRLGSNGSVLSVNVIESSGQDAFDRSVVAAVWKADPLPMPDDENLRASAQFRQHEFIFDPT